MNSNPNKQMTLTRELTASPALVWAAWTTPKYFSQWFGYPLKTKPGSTVMDVRVGGEWQSTMIGPDGKDMPFAGDFLEVTPLERLIMTFKDPANPTNPQVETLTVTFKDLGDKKTELTLHQAGFMADEQYPKLVEGYTNFMNGLADLFVA